MPLASYAWLHWYGPGLGAAVQPLPEPTADATLKGLGGLRAVGTVEPTADARINSGRLISAVHVTAPTAYARPSGRGRIAAVGRVNELTQDDVTGAVLNTPIEGDLDLRAALRLILAATRGQSEKVALPAGKTQHTYYGGDNTTARIVAVVNAEGERETVTVDPS